LRHVFLAPLHIGDVACELLAVAAQACHLAAQRLELAVEFEQAALEGGDLLQQRRVGLGGLGDQLVLPVVDLLDRLHPKPHVENRLARLVVFE
jgi:hypothetical protein